MPSVKRSERGSVLLLSYLMAASTLLVLGQVFAMRSLSESGMTQRFIASQQASQTAETGLDDAIARLANDPSYAGTDADWNGTDANDLVSIGPAPANAQPNAQRFRTRVQPTATPNRFEVLSEGRVGATIQTITAFIERTGTAPFQFAVFGEDPAGRGVELTNGSQTDSYDSAINVNPGTFGTAGHIGTNSIAPSVIYVHGSGRVNGDAQIGPTTPPNDPTTLATAIIVNTGGSITGDGIGTTRSTMPVTQTHPLPTIPYPFIPTATPSPDAANTTDPNDWKNEIIAAGYPPSVAWGDTILNHPWFPPTTLPTPHYDPPGSCSGGMGVTCTLNSLTTWPLAPSTACTVFVNAGLLVVNSTLNLTPQPSCPEGILLWVRGDLEIGLSGHINGVNRLRIGGGGPRNCIGSQDLYVRDGASISFDTTDEINRPPILYLRGEASAPAACAMVGGTINGLKYFYLDHAPYYPTRNATSSLSYIQLGVGSFSSPNTISFAYPHSILYAEGKVQMYWDSRITGLEALYTGDVAPTSVPSTNPTSLHLSSAGTSDRARISFSTAGGNIPTIYTAGGLRINNGEILNVQRVYAMGGVQATAPVTTGADSGELIFTGSNALLYSESTVSVGWGARIDNVQRVFARSDVQAVGSSTYGPGNPQSRILLNGTQDAALYALGAVTVNDRGDISQLRRLFAGDRVTVGGFMPAGGNSETCQAHGITFTGTEARLFITELLKISCAGQITHTSQRPTDLLIASTYSSTNLADDIAIANTNSRVNAGLYAPGVRVKVRDDAQVYGAVIGRNASLFDVNSNGSSNTRVHYDQQLADKTYEFSEPTTRVLAVQ